MAVWKFDNAGRLCQLTMWVGVAVCMQHIMTRSGLPNANENRKNNKEIRHAGVEMVVLWIFDLCLIDDLRLWRRRFGEHLPRRQVQGCEHVAGV